MTDTKPIPVRFDADQIARLDRVAKALSERAGGAKVSRSEVVRVAVDRGLDALEDSIARKGSTSP